MEPSGKTALQALYAVAFVLSLALLYLGRRLLRKMLPDGHPWKEKLSGTKLVRAAGLLGVALVAAYFAGVVILYG